MIPRPEYPRPQLVREYWMNLNGTWEFGIDRRGDGEKRGLHTDVSARFRQKITVPFCPESVLSGIGKTDFMPCVWYRRTFLVPEQWKGKKVLLHFGAVDYKAQVWVNGRSAGIHQGGYTSFSFDITGFLREGRNLLVVRADDDNRSGLQPAGKQSTKRNSFSCLYTRTTGIWQTVWLEAVPDTYLASFRFFTDQESGGLTVLPDIAGDTRNMVLQCRAFIGKKAVGKASLPVRRGMRLTLDISRVILWQPGIPVLYNLEFSLMRNGKVCDRVKSYFGFRKIEIDGQRVFINGRPVFQRLVLDQGYYPDGIITAPDDNALRNDIEISMAMGFNGARLHGKIFEQRFLYWADRLGYLVWGEFPNWGLNYEHPRAFDIVRAEWTEVLKRDFNHPAIIGWAPFNETHFSARTSELVRKMYRLTKKMDKTRPVVDSSGYVHVETDIYDCHNYEQDPDKFAGDFEPFKNSSVVWSNYPEHDAPYRGQPYFVSEYGGSWWNPGGASDRDYAYGTRPGTKREFLKRYKRLTETLLFHPKMFGFCYTQLYDVEQEVNGLYTYWRKPKFSPKEIRKINSQNAVIERENVKWEKRNSGL